MGQAVDGGLLMPIEIPDVSDRISDWRSYSFAELALAITDIFAPDIDRQARQTMIDEVVQEFETTEVVKLIELGDRHILELFHGPTLSFKDVALQMLGRLFDHVLGELDQVLNVVNATSGDTGSAAIAGVANRANMQIFVMFPDGRTSKLQELQMTSNIDANVHCLAIEGSFDDCQSTMKSIFNDLEFKEKHQLGAVNSINWARLMAQIVFYFYASMRFDEPVTFSVPTGNFGNILSGLIAMQMGAPIKTFVLATNENDILSRFFTNGSYARGAVHQTTSPSMDIQVASNLERFLYLHMARDHNELDTFMSRFSATGRAELKLSGTVDHRIQAARVDQQRVSGAIADYYDKEGYLLDPHTAVGVAAADDVPTEGPLICLATAHPAKFPEAIANAIPGVKPQHERLEKLFKAKTKKHVVPADVDVVKEFIASRAISKLTQAS